MKKIFLGCVIGVMLVIIGIYGRLLYINNYTYGAASAIKWSYFFRPVSKELPANTQAVQNENQIDFTKTNLFIFYKVGCPYCNGAHDYIAKKVTQLSEKAKRHLYWINVDSPVGKRLVAKYNITVAHTMVLSSPNSYYRVEENNLSAKDQYGPNLSQITNTFYFLSVAY
jgi:thioredoxin-related protein